MPLSLSKKLGTAWILFLVVFTCIGASWHRHEVQETNTHACQICQLKHEVNLGLKQAPHAIILPIFSYDLAQHQLTYFASPNLDLPFSPRAPPCAS